MALVQVYTGRAHYGADFAEGSQRLFVSLACRVGDHPDRADALFDSASEWCVLTPRVAQDLGFAVESGAGSVILHCRFGSIRGEYMRIPVEFLAAEGEELTVDATWFVSGDWPGPLVIGWKGCLERFRFGLDPGDESFYFGEFQQSA